MVGCSYFCYMLSHHFSFVCLHRTFSWRMMRQSSSGTLARRVFWTGTGTREATICGLLLSSCSVPDSLSSHLNCVAAQSPTLMRMLGRHIMWLQKSGTTSHTTIRGILPSCLSNWFLLYMAQDQMKHLVAKPYCGGSNESFKKLPCMCSAVTCGPLAAFSTSSAPCDIRYVSPPSSLSVYYCIVVLCSIVNESLYQIL